MGIKMYVLSLPAQWMDADSRLQGDNKNNKENCSVSFSSHRRRRWKVQKRETYTTRRSLRLYLGWEREKEGMSSRGCEEDRLNPGERSVERIWVLRRAQAGKTELDFLMFNRFQCITVLLNTVFTLCFQRVLSFYCAFSLEEAIFFLKARVVRILTCVSVELLKIYLYIYI